jgi:hypothetical protein
MGYDKTNPADNPAEPGKPGRRKNTKNRNAKKVKI